MDLALDGSTTNRYLASIILARRMNQVLGGAIYGPEDMDFIDPIWLEAFEAWVEEYEGGTQAKDWSDKLFADFERRHGYKWV